MGALLSTVKNSLTGLGNLLSKAAPKTAVGSNPYTDQVMLEGFVPKSSLPPTPSTLSKLGDMPLKTAAKGFGRGLGTAVATVGVPSIYLAAVSDHMEDEYGGETRQQYANSQIPLMTDAVARGDWTDESLMEAPGSPSMIQVFKKPKNNGLSDLSALQAAVQKNQQHQQLYNDVTHALYEEDNAPTVLTKPTEVISPDPVKTVQANPTIVAAQPKIKKATTTSLPTSNKTNTNTKDKDKNDGLGWLSDLLPLLFAGGMGYLASK